MLRVIVPAAGESKRFKAKGILRPKPLLKFSWKHSAQKTMLEHAVSGTNSPIQVICQEKDVVAFQQAIPAKFSLYTLFESKGQADTVAQLILSSRIETDPILIVNSDCMFLYSLDIFVAQARQFPAAALVFDGDYNPAYSYVDDFPIFRYAVEKEPISPWALAGAFYFDSAQKYLKAFDKYRAENRPEEYVSEVYNYIEGDKLAVYIPREQLVGWGTPDEFFSDSNISNIEL